MVELSERTDILGYNDSSNIKVSRNNLDCKFRKAFDVVPRAYAEVCSIYQDKYEKRLDKDGVESFVVIGKEPIYEQIQTYAEDTDINVIIARCVKETGSIDILDAKNGDFADVTDLPTDLYELLNLTRSIEEEFHSLPIDEQELFNNNSKKYAQARLEETAFDTIKKFRESKITPEGDVENKEVKDE